MLNSVLRNPISRVHFAGFESDTLRLQRAGWQLSMEQDPHFSRIRLALKHEAGRFFAISHPVTYEMMARFHQAFRGGAPPPIDFQIAWLGNEASFQIIPQMGAMSFRPVSAIPEYQETKDVAFEDAIPFRPLNAEAPEIVVAPQSVPELMELVLKLQDPKQKELREKARREAWRTQGSSQAMDGYSPAADIKAQIIALPLAG